MADLSAAELNQAVANYEGKDILTDLNGVPDDQLASLPGRSCQDLSRLLLGADSAPPINLRELQDGIGIVLDQVLTRRECLAIIEATEETGYAPIGEARHGAVSVLRNNLWLQITDSTDALSAQIWKRIAPYVPSEQTLEDDPAIWRAVGCNSNFRFAKYVQHLGPTAFAKHIDRPTIDEHDRCSMYTVNIYLNDLSQEQSGKTRFWSHPKGMGKPVDHAGGTAGSVCLFKQANFSDTPWHDGQELKSGVKYLMRTDVIYVRDS